MPAPSAPSVAPYRLPSIALVQPQDGGAVYQDRPVIVLRFALGEATDPIDATSLAVNVDGMDRTKLFQTSGSDAWGPLVPGGAVDSLTIGAHHVTARICSQRGVCAVMQATILAIPNVAAATPAAGRSIHQRIRDAALSIARRILVL